MARVLVIGATGTIGSEVVRALSSDGHEVVEVSRSHTPIVVDIADIASIGAMYESVGEIDAVVCAAGNTAKRRPLAQMTDEDFAYSMANKLMGQVNVIRYGFDHVSDGGSFTVTSGILGREPIPGSETISLVNLGLEGFVRAAALEAPRGIRVNVVSPPWLVETLKALGMQGIQGMTAAEVARIYVAAVFGEKTGSVFESIFADGLTGKV